MSCAKIESPPGGPPDQTPPILVSTLPDSLAIMPRFKGAVEFRFDEVISEGSQASQGLGTSDLERLIVLSPTTEVPRVSWKRTTLAVEPREGWQPNRVYRIELRPGVMDIRRNRLDSGAVVTFTTGAPLPTLRLRGSVVDWQAGHMARPGMIEAILLPDSLPYRTLTDSSGSFSFGPLPRGTYLVYGVIDQNKNLRRESRDNWDSVRVQPDSEQVAVLWAAPHDTLGPRLQSVSPADSTAAELTFSQPIDPYQEFDSTNARVRLLPDSTPVPVVSLLPKSIDDRIQSDLRKAADTTRSALDTSRSAALDSARASAAERLKSGGRPAQKDSSNAILATRPVLTDRMVLRVGTVLKPGAKYQVEVRGIRNVSRVPADSRSLLTIPETPPPSPADSVKGVSPDSTKPDSIRGRPDSVPAPPKP
ncbi:MAG: Ig-like domain-containing protein [Gemmatimonadota bacterium]